MPTNQPAPTDPLSATSRSRWAPASGPAIGRQLTTREGRVVAQAGPHQQRGCDRPRPSDASATVQHDVLPAPDAAAQLVDQRKRLAERRRVEVGHRMPHGLGGRPQPPHVARVAVIELMDLVERHDGGGAETLEERLGIRGHGVLPAQPQSARPLVQRDLVHAAISRSLRVPQAHGRTMVRPASSHRTVNLHTFVSRRSKPADR